MPSNLSLGVALGAVSGGPLRPAWLPEAAVAGFNALIGQSYGLSMTFQRASAALWDGSGDWAEYPENVLRRLNGVGAIIEPAFSDLGNYATTAGAVLGVLGSGGALPTGWEQTATTSGVAVEVVAFGETDGLPSIDVRFSGTPSANWRIRPSAAQYLSVAEGESYIVSAFVALVAGSLPQTDDARIGAIWYTSGGAFITASLADIGGALTANLDRHSTAVTAPATAAKANIDLFSVTQGAAIDFTLRFAAPNMGLGSVPSTPVLPEGAPVERAGDEMTLTPVSVAALDWHARYDDNSEGVIASAVTGAFAIDPAELTRPEHKLFWATASA